MSDALLPYPTDWKQLLNPFASCFTKPQFGNFCQTTTALAVSCHSSISRWAQIFAPKHQSSLNDFFTESPWDDATVHSKLTRITSLRVRDAQLGIIDDTLSHKPYAKKMAHVGWFYDGLTKKKQHGHSIVTSGVRSRELGFVPVDVQLYQKNGLTKNDIACAMIERTQKQFHLPLYAVDSWYSNNQTLGKIRREKAHYVTEVKANRNATIDNKKRFVREHERHIVKKQWRTAKIGEATYRFFQTSAFIESLGSVNLVFSQKYFDDDKKWSETFYLITDVLSLVGERVIELFLLRGSIEGFHRESKQQLGLEGYHLRNSRGIERYLFLVLLVYVLLLLMCQNLMRKLLDKKTIGQLREHLKAACYTTLLQNSRHMTQEDIEATAKTLAVAL